MLYIQVLNRRDAPEARNLALHLIKGTGCPEQVHPAVLILTGHVIVRINDNVRST